jgi:uncharacterized membrane protein YkvA (DUF1232 family)
MLDQIKIRARALKREVFAVYLAAKDPRTPWYAKGLILLIVAYAFSPIDLIPDFVPVLGYVDDLIIIPGGIWLAIRMIPPEVLTEARRRVAAGGAQEIGRIGAVTIVFLWILTIAAAIWLVLHITKGI